VSPKAHCIPGLRACDRARSITDYLPGPDAESQLALDGLVVARPRPLNVSVRQLRAAELLAKFTEVSGLRGEELYDELIQLAHTLKQR
jgi:hypothetical protein